MVTSARLLPAAISDKLNQPVNVVLKAPEMQKQLRDLGAEPGFGSSDTFSADVRTETVKSAGLVKSANIVP